MLIKRIKTWISIICRTRIVLAALFASMQLNKNYNEKSRRLIVFRQLTQEVRSVCLGKWENKRICESERASGSESLAYKGFHRGGRNTEV